LADHAVTSAGGSRLLASAVTCGCLVGRGWFIYNKELVPPWGLAGTETRGQLPGDEATQLRACVELAQWGRPWSLVLLSHPVGNEGAGISAA
jgi:hypothetical protein